MKKLLVVASMLVLVGCSEDADQADGQAEYPYDVVATDTHEEFELTLLKDENTYYKAIRYLGEESEIDIQSSSRPFTSALYVGDDVYGVDVEDIATIFTLEGNNPYTEEVLVNDNIQENENGVLSVTATFYYNDEHYELQVESRLETDQASVNVENYEQARLMSMDSDHFSVDVSEAYASYAHQEKLDYDSDTKVIAIPRTDNLSIITVDNESMTEKELEEMVTEHSYITVYIDYDASAHYHNELGEQEDPSYPVIESSVLIIDEHESN